MTDSDYPFHAEWLQAQAEPMPDFGGSLFGNNEPSPLTIERLPERGGERSKELEERRKKL